MHAADSESLLRADFSLARNGTCDVGEHARRVFYLPMQKELKIAPSRSSLVYVPVMLPSACCA